MITFSELQDRCAKIEREKGFSTSRKRELPGVLMLCVSELSEALEEYRSGRDPSEEYNAFH